MNKYRKVISVLLAISFAYIAVSGVLMKFFFRGHFLNETHGWVGLVMVVAALVHLVLNWKPLSGYLRRDRWLYWLAVPFVAYLLLLAVQKDEPSGLRVVFQKLLVAKAGDAAPAFGKNPDQALAVLRAAGLQVDGPNETIQQIGEQNHRQPEDVLSLLAR